MKLADMTTITALPDPIIISEPTTLTIGDILKLL